MLLRDTESIRIQKVHLFTSLSHNAFFSIISLAFSHSGSFARSFALARDARTEDLFPACRSLLPYDISRSRDPRSIDRFLSFDLYFPRRISNPDSSRFIPHSESQRQRQTFRTFWTFRLVWFQFDGRNRAFPSAIPIE